MKKSTIFLSLATILSLVFAGYQRYENKKLIERLVHQATVNQFDIIDARARAFMEMNYHTTFVPGGTSINSLRKYEKTISIPEDKKKEFTEWMSGYSVNPVSGYNDKNGASQKSDNGKLIYRVYYGDAPQGW